MKSENLSRITGVALEVALGHLSPKFNEGWNYQRLADETISELDRRVRMKFLNPKRASNAHIRRKLKNLSNKADSIYREISNISEDFIISQSFKDEDHANFMQFIFDETSGYAEFRRSVPIILTVAEFLRRTAENVESQSPKWREKEQQQSRILIANHIISAYSKAFSEKPTVNNAANIEHWQGPTTFAVFYQEIMSLAFQEKRTPNLAEILKEALKNFNAG